MTTVAPSARSTIPFRDQLRTRLALAFVALVVVSIVVVTGLTLNQVHEQTARQTFRQLESVAQLKQNQITRWLDNANEQLSVIFTELNRSSDIPSLLTASQPDAQRIDAINSALQNIFHTLGQGNSSKESTATEIFVYTIE